MLILKAKVGDTAKLVGDGRPDNRHRCGTCGGMLRTCTQNPVCSLCGASWRFITSDVALRVA